MEYFAIKDIVNAGIYTNKVEFFNILEKAGFNTKYKVFYKENEARKYLGYPLIDVEQDSCKNLKDFSFGEIDPKVLPGIPFSLTKRKCVAFVDGSYNENESIYGAGVLLLTNNKVFVRKESYSDKLNKFRNISGELLAIIIAMDTAIDFGYDIITIYHDVTLPIPNIRGNISPKSYITRIFIEYLRSVKSYINYTFIKVKGHDNNTFHDVADKLAKLSTGINEFKLSV